MSVGFASPAVAPHSEQVNVGQRQVECNRLQRCEITSEHVRVGRLPSHKTQSDGPIALEGGRPNGATRRLATPEGSSILNPECNRLQSNVSRLASQNPQVWPRASRLEGGKSV